MIEKPGKSASGWIDPDDAPEWTDAMIERSELAEGGRVLRPAEGTVTVARGRPRSESPKHQVTLRLSAKVVEHFRSAGPGWQTRIDEALLKVIDG